MTDKHICPRCQEIMEIYDEPNELYSISIPFTKIEIKILKWIKAHYCPCKSEDWRRRQDEECYYAGWDDAVDKYYSESSL